MIIKKFTGRTEEEALEAARKELGSGIVTMNVRSVKRKGLAGLFRAKQTEVTVALEEDKESLRSVRREVPVSGKAAEAAAANAGVRQADARSAISFMSENSQNIEKKLDSLQTLLVNRLQQEENGKADQPASGEETAPGQEHAGSVEKETEKQETTDQDKFVRLLYNTMLENEVDEKYANQIINDVDKTGKPDLPMDYILADVYQKMILKFSRAKGITPAEKGPKVVLFMGPTGVGKTTTIAKIASAFAVDQKKKVALLTADTYRIAAAEQLRTYANILEVPFRVIYTPEEAAEAVKDYGGCDCILVDTAGHSHQNEEQMNNMKKLLEAVEQTAECQTFLVLSATTKYRDLLKIVDGYRGMSHFQLIFTKLDETATLGNLLNIKLYTDTPIAFVTCGQNVPDDIELFNPQKTVKQLLSTKH